MINGNTFKVVMGSNDTNWLIGFGSDKSETPKQFLHQYNEMLFNFETEIKAKAFIKRLNKIANSVEHQNK